MTSSKKVVLMSMLIAASANVFAQDLRVTLSPDKRKIDRNADNGIATIVFDSKVKGLTINSGSDDTWTMPSDNMFVYLIDTKQDLKNGFEYSKRVFVLNSPESTEYILEIDEILPKQFFYYTIVLPKKYPVTLSAEWLLNLNTQKGIRISYGGQYGFYLGGTLGDYKPSGDNINKITSDCDLGYAKKVGHIRTTIFGGCRVGLFNNDKMITYGYIGIGYGEYGCQWENRTRLENSKYFYSDYMKGINTNLGISVIYNGFVYSFGGDMVFEKDKFRLDWQLGLGYSLNLNKRHRHKN